jgi:hypothetical protein
VRRHPVAVEVHDVVQDVLVGLGRVPDPVQLGEGVGGQAVGPHVGQPVEVLLTPLQVVRNEVLVRQERPHHHLPVRIFFRLAHRWADEIGALLVYSSPKEIERPVSY